MLRIHLEPSQLQCNCARIQTWPHLALLHRPPAQLLQTLVTVSSSLRHLHESGRSGQSGALHDNNKRSTTTPQHQLPTLSPNPLSSSFKSSRAPQCRQLTSSSSVNLDLVVNHVRTFVNRKRYITIILLEQGKQLITFIYAAPRWTKKR